MTHLQLGRFRGWDKQFHGIRWFLGITLAVGSLAGAVQAADDAKDVSKKVEEIPDSLPITLKTRDGVQLKATFYPGTKGKKSVPIVILHGLKGSRANYKDLALTLQKAGHAVLVPDLRGHGDSTVQLRGMQRVELNSRRTSKNDMVMMINQDLEAVRDFLFDKNNAEELNLNKLTLIGVDMGAVVAANWAYYDWDRDELTTYQNGRDVKALVLISPDWSIRGLSMARAMDNSTLQGKLSLLLMVGAKDKKALEATEKIEAKVARYHPEPAKEDLAEKKTLYVVKLPTSLQSAKLVNQPELKADQIIAAFVDLRLVKQSFPWSLHNVPRR